MGIIMTQKTLRPRQKNDVYPTPVECCRASLKLFDHLDFQTILDPGCGNGPWGQAAREIWPNAWIEGIDIEPGVNSAYNVIHTGDYFKGDCLTYKHYDCIIGNPPYRLAERFVRRSFDLLADRSVMVQLLRLAFLEGQDRGKHLWRAHPPVSVYVLSRRPSFTANGKTDATAYGIYIFDTNHPWGHPPSLHWLDWDYDK